MKPARLGCTVLVANYHAPEETSAEKNIELLRSFGAETIVLQRDIFNADFFFALLNIVSVPELERMPQFRNANNPLDHSRTAQLLTYPVLMAHDVAGYEKVYVGEDQIPHIDFARKIIGRYNYHQKTDVLCPEPVVSSAKITDLRFSSMKMSKTHPEGCLFLDDSPEQIVLKIKRAVTDGAGVENLRVLYREFVDEEMPESYGVAKTVLADAIISILGE